MNEAELLFTETLKCSRASLYLGKKDVLDKASALFIARALRRRARQEPIQYILGKSEFMGLEFKLSEAVLIPRPETEILVETVIRLVSGVRNPACYLPVGEADYGLGIKILDIGTGSGNIAISLAKFLPNVQITATDISQEALDIAKENAQLNKVGDRAIFIKANLFPNTKHQRPGTDIIVSNPPYIPSAEIDKLQPQIQYEPRAALDGGDDGLDFYRRIIGLSPGYLKEGGLLAIEIGCGQLKAIKNIFKKSGNFNIIEMVKDYNGIERVIVAQYKDA
jgi:release factor glutamine methyltransferase